MYRRIVLANPSSIDARGALEPALTLAESFGARLTMLVVERRPPFPLFMTDVDESRAASETKSKFIIARAEERAAKAKVPFEAHRSVGTFVSCILRFLAKTPADLLVVGRGDDRSGFASWFDTPGRLIRETHCAIHITGSSLESR